MKSSRSFPALNESPAPCSSTTLISSSVAAASTSSATVAYMAEVSAFFLAGRLNCTCRMLSERSVMISVVIRFALGSDKGADAGDRLADDQVLHLIGTFVGIERLGIREEARNLIVEADAVAAEQLTRPCHGFAHPGGCKCLG